MTDRVVVITGASSGLGRGAALRFAGAGAAVVLAARREGALTVLAAECEGAGARAMAIPTDVGDPEEVQRLAELAVHAFGRIDVWVNAAGVGAIGEFTRVPIADHERVVITNLMGTIHGSYCALERFIARGSGTLINIASALGKVPAPYYASYTASKYGVVGLSAALRQEMQQGGHDAIRVCTVLPMAADTPFFDHAANYTGHEAVPIPPLYDPRMAIDAIVRLVDEPEDEVVVGAAGKIATALHSVLPGMIEHRMAEQTRRAQLDEAPAAPVTAGSVHEPVARGTTVSGGRLHA